jgi:hypothetical protein
MENCLRAVPVFRTASRKRSLLAKARANRAERHTQGHVLVIVVGLENSDQLVTVENLVGARTQQLMQEP